MRTNTVKEHLPAYYGNILEMNIIASTNDSVLDTFEVEQELLLARQFVRQSDEEGIAYYEMLLDIVPDTTAESLEFRRGRLLNRLALTAPFTMKYLYNVLDNVVGEGKWECSIDYANYTLYVESSAVDQQWFLELIRVINMIKPANIVFMNVPRSSLLLAIKENILYTKNTYMYNLGTTFRLGMTTFMEENVGGNVKLENARSLEQPLFTDVAQHVQTLISSVLINNSVVITDFEVLETNENVVSLTYFVSAEQVNSITNVKLRNAAGQILSNVNVYVPIVDEVSMKHTITVREL